MATNDWNPKQIKIELKADAIKWTLVINPIHNSRLFKEVL